MIDTDREDPAADAPPRSTLPALGTNPLGLSQDDWQELFPEAVLDEAGWPIIEPHAQLGERLSARLRVWAADKKAGR